MRPSSWWADEMLGRLARYMRIVGLDTAYRTGLADDELIRRSTVEGRTVITRDRTLSRRAPAAVLISSVQIEEQWRELRSRFPTIPEEPSFERCTLCNGRLVTVPAPGPGDRGSPVPVRVRESGGPIYRCEACRHVYWEGSHTDSIRKRLARWSQVEAK